MNTSLHTSQIYQVDAFTSENFKGNPAAVCILNQEREGGFLQNVAMEMNLSETAFLLPDDGFFNIRFFTPFAEVPLCGHAALAAAHVLYEQGLVEEGASINLKTSRYDLVVVRENGFLKMDFPTYPLKQVGLTSEFEEITGVFPLELYKSSHDWHIAVVKSQEEIKKIKPFFSKMKHSDFGHLIVTSVGDDTEYDFLLRCFAPIFGINEDPVTGSAHCALVPLWHDKLGKKEFISFQASKRTGIIRSRLINDSRIEILGSAVTIFKGELLI